MVDRRKMSAGPGRISFPSGCRPSANYQLLGIELNNELLLHRHREIFANWKAFDKSLHIFLFEIEPLWHTPPHNGIQRIRKGLNFSALLSQLDGVADLYLI